MAEPAIPTASVADFEFPSAVVTACPFPFYEALRREQPVYKLPGREEYVVSRWEDIAYATRHPEIFSSAKPDEAHVLELIRLGHSQVSVAEHAPDWREPTGEEFAATTPPRYSPLNMALTDAPQHKVRRALAHKIVARERMQAYPTLIRRVANELIDAFVDEGTIEYVAAFADPLPIYVVGEILGLPREDLDRYRRLPAAERELLAGAAPREGEDEVVGSAAYMRKALVDRLDQPQDDFLSEFVRGAFERDGELDLPHLIADAGTLRSAGHFTTTHMLSSMMLLLLEHPEELRRVRADQSLLRGTVEEALRLESPIQWLERRTTMETELGGVTIPAGALVLLLWGSGNRDDERFDDPDRFCADRPNAAKNQLAFGFGPHLCVGAPLARLEGQIAFETLFARSKHIRLAPGRNDFAHVERLNQRGLKSLWLEVEPADER